MDFGNASVLAMTQRTDESEDIEAELMVRQGESTFGFGANGGTKMRANKLGAGANLKTQTNDRIQSSENAMVVGIDSKVPATVDTSRTLNVQWLVFCRGGSFAGSCHRSFSLLGCSFLSKNSPFKGKASLPS
jgi:hypothetical protein